MFLLVAVSAFFITAFGMPNLIKVAKLKRLVDDPEKASAVWTELLTTNSAATAAIRANTMTQKCMLMDF